MATRKYRRDSRGRFAGSGGGSMITYGKAGGFANSAFRNRINTSKSPAAKKPTRSARSVLAGTPLRRKVTQGAISVGITLGAAGLVTAASDGPRALRNAADNAKTRRSVNKQLEIVNMMARKRKLSQRVNQRLFN